MNSSNKIKIFLESLECIDFEPEYYKLFFKNLDSNEI
jgi:hypothetical protein